MKKKQICSLMAFLFFLVLVSSFSSFAQNTLNFYEDSSRDNVDLPEGIPQEAVNWDYTQWLNYFKNRYNISDAEYEFLNIKSKFAFHIYADTMVKYCNGDITWEESIEIITNLHNSGTITPHGHSGEDLFIDSLIELNDEMILIRVSAITTINALETLRRVRAYCKPHKIHSDYSGVLNEPDVFSDGSSRKEGNEGHNANPINPGTSWKKMKLKEFYDLFQDVKDAYTGGYSDEWVGWDGLVFLFVKLENPGFITSDLEFLFQTVHSWWWGVQYYEVTRNYRFKVELEFPWPHVDIEVVDDDTIQPDIEVQYYGDKTDGNPGFFRVTASDSSGLSLDPSGYYSVPNDLGTHYFTFIATDADNDRSGDTLTRSKTVSVNIRDDDTKAPSIYTTYYGDSTDGNPGYFSVNAYDSSGLSSDPTGCYNVPNFLGFYYYTFTATDADNDRPKDSLTTTISTSINIQDDDTVPPTLICKYYGDYTDVDPGYIEVIASDSSGLSVNPSGKYILPNLPQRYEYIFKAIDADNDRPGDSLITEETIELLILDDDPTPPISQINYVGGDYTDGNPGYWAIQAFDWESGLDEIQIIIDGNLYLHDKFLNGLPIKSYNVPIQPYYSIPIDPGINLGLHNITVIVINNDTDWDYDQEFTVSMESILIKDDDTSAPIIDIEYNGDGNDGNPGYFKWNITDIDDGIGGDGDIGINEIEITLNYESMEGLDNYILSLPSVETGTWYIPPFLGTYTLTIMATDNDDDRKCILSEINIVNIDFLSQDISNNQMIIDDDITPPELSNLVITHNIHNVNISLDAIDQSGIKNIIILVNGEEIIPVEQIQNEHTFSFILLNQWILKNGIYNIEIQVMDADSDRSNDSLKSSISGTFEVTLEDIYSYVDWQIEELKAYIDENLCWIISRILNHELCQAQKHLQEAYYLIESGKTICSLFYDTIAKIYLRISEFKTKILNLFNILDDEEAEQIIQSIHIIRNQVVALMGASVGTEQGYNIASIEIGLLDLNDFIEEGINCWNRWCLENHIKSAALMLELAIIQISLDQNVECALTCAQYELIKAEWQVSYLLDRGRISKELADMILCKIIQAKESIEAIKTPI